MPAHACDFEMAQNSNHSFFSYFLLEILITCLLAEVTHFFSSKKLRWLKFGIIFASNSTYLRMVRISSHLKIRCICWHVTLSPSMTF